MENKNTDTPTWIIYALTVFNTVMIIGLFFMALKGQTQNDVNNFHRCVERTSQADIDICKCAQQNNLEYICEDLLDSQ